MTSDNSSTASGGGAARPSSAQPARASDPGASGGQGAAIAVTAEGGRTRVAFSGELTTHTLHKVQNELRNALRNSGGEVRFDLSALERLDTAGALLINLCMDTLRADGRAGTVLDPTEVQAKLLKQSVLPEIEAEKGPRPLPAPLRLVQGYGRAVCDGLRSTGELVAFLGQFLVLLVSLVAKPWRMRWTSLVFHMEQVGLRAVPIVSLLTFLIGLVVAYMGAQQLAMFGADIFAVNLLEVMVLREMAVLITAIVVAGRSSSSFTAQIGAMVANEEVDALRSMGLKPGMLLVVPRVLALIVTLPMLVFLADIMALLGGALAIWVTLDINFNAFLTQLESVAKLDNFMVGMVKTPFFAMSIGLVGCFQGFRATGSAESVGMLTTVSVVQSIFIVILLDALFAMFFTTIGI